MYVGCETEYNTTVAPCNIYSAMDVVSLNIYVAHTVEAWKEDRMHYTVQSAITVLAENRPECLLEPVTGSSGSKFFVMIKSGTSVSVPLILQLA